ncbi:ABC transporter ATP-binding protein [Prolixibacteraceae bacterium JC049]|nr:ABC transporter ATP-binding protein [Prolixibacteraceae bacterium JC049]
MSTLIQLEDISYSYDNHPALSDVNLTIEAGKAYALIGENGSGKSTLLKIINGLLYPSSGTYQFMGNKITSKTLRHKQGSRQFHQRIGFVFQNPEVQLFSPTVYEELAFAPRQMQLDEIEVKQRVMDCLKMLNIEHLIHREPIYLSDGEKKRVAIASVLTANPQVLTLDEPLNGLDPRSKRFLLQLMLKLKAAGKTIICSTHDLNYWKSLFDVAVVMNDQKKIEKVAPYNQIIEDEAFLTQMNVM